MSDPNLMGRLRQIRHVALDMDGTIYRGGELFDFTVPFLERLDGLGVGYTFLTNNSSKSVAQYLANLRKMGVPADADKLFTSTHATIAHLRREVPQARRLFALAAEGMRQELADAGFELTRPDADDEPDALVVGFDTGLAYDRLCAAAYWAQQGKPYVASNPDRFCPTDLPTVLVDCGAMCAAIEVATGRKPDAVAGKPDPHMLQSLMERHGLRPDAMAMVGDRVTTDVGMARRAEALSVLVLTGDSTEAEAASAQAPPDLVLADLKELGDLLGEVHA